MRKSNIRSHATWLGSIVWRRGHDEAASIHPENPKIFNFHCWKSMGKTAKNVAVCNKVKVCRAQKSFWRQLAIIVLFYAI